MFRYKSVRKILKDTVRRLMKQKEKQERKYISRRSKERAETKSINSFLSKIYCEMFRTHSKLERLGNLAKIKSKRLLIHTKVDQNVVSIWIDLSTMFDLQDQYLSMDEVKQQDSVAEKKWYLQQQALDWLNESSWCLM